jgi:chromosomal replication initiation ATPase DnaA
MQGRYKTPIEGDKVDHILEVIADYFNTSKTMILESKRKSEHTRLRQIVIYFLYKKTNMSSSVIYSIFSNSNNDIKKHSNMVHAHNSILEEICTDKTTAIQITKINGLIRISNSERYINKNRALSNSE